MRRNGWLICNERRPAMNSNPSRTLDALLLPAVSTLTAAGIEDARLDVEYLLAHLLHCQRRDLRRQLNAVEAALKGSPFADLLARRERREPLQRILGRWEFWGLDLELGPETLIPRPDTECIVDAVLKCRSDRSQALRLLDLGTGSGALLLALLSEFPNAWGLGIDLSPAAAGIARRNADQLGLGQRAAFCVADWTTALSGEMSGEFSGLFDVIVSNPPYIPTGDLAGLQPEVALHEPRLALDGGVDGLDACSRLMGDLPRLLRSGGLVLVEHGFDQGERVATLLREAGLTEIQTLRDLAGQERVGFAIKV
jgi:release factor glutamine methyltransferase